jgi:HEAT repeat protein
MTFFTNQRSGRYSTPGFCANRVAMVLAWLLFGVEATTLWGQSTAPLQHLWEVQPDFGNIWFVGNTARSTFIDVEGLGSDQARVRLDTARMICLNYDREGFEEQKRAIEWILRSLSNPEESILIQRAMMSAVCALDDGSHAEQLWRVSRTDPVLDLTLQRALIDWKSSIAIDSWRKTVRDPAASSLHKRLAIDGLGAVGSAEDSKLLTNILESESATQEQRVSAAAALGNLQRSGLCALAQKYLDSKFSDRDRIAVYLVRNDANAEALTILQSAYDTGSAPAQRLAATAIALNFPDAATDRVPVWLKNPDRHFRELALRVSMAASPDQAIQVAETLLRDEDARARTAARRALLDTAKAGNRPAVDRCLQKQLDGNDPRSLEQAIILTVELQDVSRCERLLRLLEHPNAEVHMHAAWALMDLSEKGPILDSMLEHAATMTNTLESGTSGLSRSEIIKLSFLLEAFGRHRYEPAYDMLVKYIPKNDFKMGNLSRASAIWSIGRLRSDADDPSLRAQLRERISDMPPDKPENYLVRFACIVALGEFGFPESLEIIDRYGGAPPNPLGYAAQWARARIAESGK